MTVFETERLIIRQWTEDPADVARAFDTLSRWEVSRWLGASPRVMESPDQALTAVRRWRAVASENDVHGIWAVEVRDSGVVAGTVLVVPLPGVDDEPTEDVEIGWHFHPDSWGYGYATESAQVAMDRAFAAGLPEIYAVVHPGNDRSVAVTRRLGMTPIGVQTKWYGGTPFETYVRKAR
jgi:RimJ/RimL family protein N-acetyltransferase